MTTYINNKSLNNGRSMNRSRTRGFRFMSLGMAFVAFLNATAMAQPPQYIPTVPDWNQPTLVT